MRVSPNLEKKSSVNMRNIEDGKPRSSSASLNNVEDERPEKIKEKDIMTKWREYKLWEKRIQDMADPRVGWSPNDENEETQETPNENDDLSEEREWVDLIETHANEIGNADEIKVLNFAVIWAIIDFVFE